jgi:hypothetical protein
MTDIIAPLSDDERTVLLCAIGGGSMIPVGRWEEPVKSLARRGYLKMLDPMNYVITDAGRKASDDAEDDILRDYLKAGQRYAGR